MRHKLIIDTDCGGDDIVAIMCALSHPNTEIMAITTTWGNVDVDQGMENMGKLMDFMKVNIPFYRGAAEPLMCDRETTQWPGYGSDGMGDADFFCSGRHLNQSSKHAALVLVDLLGSLQPEDDVVFQLVCLGPLTNVALALKLNPHIFDHLGSDEHPGVVIMGGSTEAKGNSGLTAEFNFHCDPEAAKMVFRHATQERPLLVVGWELTLTCGIPWAFFDAWVGRRTDSPNETQVFLKKLLGRFETFTRRAADGTAPDLGSETCTQDESCVLPDVVAMLAALDYKSFITKSCHTYSTVESTGALTRGTLCIDWYATDASLAKNGRVRNSLIALTCNSNLYLFAMSCMILRDISFKYTDHSTVKNLSTLITKFSSMGIFDESAVQAEKSKDQIIG